MIIFLFDYRPVEYSKSVCPVQIPVDVILKALCNYNDVETSKKLNQKTTTT